MFKNFLVIIPTYNESENINDLINELSRHGFHILVVDDNSPDGTFEIVLNNEKYGQNLFGIKRTSNKGYGKSVIDGFKFGIEKQYQYFVQMDSDFSHRVKDLLKMTELSSKYDLVIGSRYIDGGAIEGWGLIRKYLSKISNLFAKFLLKTNISDLTTGFRIYSLNSIKSIEFQKIDSNGYSFLVELLYKIIKGNFKIIEYPIIFVNRTRGKSKMDFKIIIESMVNLFKIYLKK